MSSRFLSRDSWRGRSGEHFRAHFRTKLALLDLRTYNTAVYTIDLSWCHHKKILIKKTLVKLTISNPKLNMIETGRYDKISRCDRICPVCGLNIEDKIYFLFDCPKYSSIRDDFFNKIDNRIANYKHIPMSTLITQLINSTDCVRQRRTPS